MKIIQFQGGLGNQMFQYAFYRNLKEKGYKIYACRGFLECHNGYELDKIFGIKLNYKKFKFKENIFIKCLKILLGKIFGEQIIYQRGGILKESFFKKKGYLYIGYWQNEKYFLDIEDIIRKEFIFPRLSSSDVKNYNIQEKILKTNSVSIHIRRGDYLLEKKYDVITKEYYKKAIRYIEKKINNPIFYIFSDDIDWCKKNFQIEGEYYYIGWNKQDNSYKDMHLMSLCKNNIITNSTFSWWGAWLNSNQDKIVIAPERWCKNISENIYRDIVPNSWIKIKNY